MAAFFISIRADLIRIQAALHRRLLSGISLHRVQPPQYLQFYLADRCRIPNRYVQCPEWHLPGLLSIGGLIPRHEDKERGVPDPKNRTYQYM